MQYLSNKKIILPLLIKFLYDKSCFVYLFSSIYILQKKKHFKLKTILIYTLIIQSILSYMVEVNEFFDSNKEYYWRICDIFWSFITIITGFLFLKKNNLIEKNKQILVKTCITSFICWISAFILIRLPIYSNNTEINNEIKNDPILILWALFHTLWHLIPFYTSIIIVYN